MQTYWILGSRAVNDLPSMAFAERCIIVVLLLLGELVAEDYHGLNKLFIELVVDVIGFLHHCNLFPTPFGIFHQHFKASTHIRVLGRTGQCIAKTLSFILLDSDRGCRLSCSFFGQKLVTFGSEMVNEMGFWREVSWNKSTFAV